MREIKFRAWVESENKMMSVVGISWMLNIQEGDVEVGSVLCAQEDNGAWSAGGDHEADDVVLMQCSGLKDKNNTDIYDGDIVRVIDIDTSEESLHTVKYYAYDDYPAFDLSPVLFEESNSFSGIACSMQYEIEVVGNIYEIHDLLGV